MYYKSRLHNFVIGTAISVREPSMRVSTSFFQCKASLLVGQWHVSLRGSDPCAPSLSGTKSFVRWREKKRFSRFSVRSRETRTRSAASIKPWRLLREPCCARKPNLSRLSVVRSLLFTHVPRMSSQEHRGGVEIVVLFKQRQQRNSNSPPRNWSLNPIVANDQKNIYRLQLSLL